MKENIEQAQWKRFQRLLGKVWDSVVHYHGKVLGLKISETLASAHGDDSFNFRVQTPDKGFTNRYDVFFVYSVVQPYLITVLIRSDEFPALFTYKTDVDFHNFRKAKRELVRFITR